jgi:membrane-associated phospholipid phosphatase
MRKRVTALVVLFVCAVLFAMRFRSNGGPTLGDEAVLRFFNGVVFVPATIVVKITSWLGSVLFIGPVSVLLACVIVRRSRADAFQLPLAGLGASFVHLFLKISVPRARPQLFPPIINAPGEGTFPSGHAVNVTAFAVTVVFVAMRHWPERARAIVVGSTILIAWVCATRLYLQVHWPSDMLSGVLIGGTWAMFLEVVLHARSEVR